MAVIAVIVDHFDKALLPSGFLGVDIFFVISGYVISSSLYNNSAKSFVDFIGGFYSRRLKRLVPALVLCVLVTSILICVFDPDPWTSLRTGKYALVGLSNVYLLRHSTDYFGAYAQFNAFLHTWSLGVEEQFYVVFPLILWFSGFTRRHSKGLRNLLGVLGFLAFCSLVLFIRESKVQPPAAFFLMPARFWELSAGCAVFVVLHIRPRLVVPLGEQLPSQLVLLLLAAALFVPAQYPVFTTITVVLLTALLIVSVRPDSVGYKVLAHPAAMYVGRISYSLYLWHWPVLVLSRWTVGIRWWLAPLQVGLMFLLAATSYKYVESPLRRAAWSPVRWKSVLYAIGASACAAAVLLSLDKSFATHLYTGKRIPERSESLTDPYSLSDGSSVWRGEPCILGDNTQVGKTIPFDGCTLGNPVTANHRILVLGNSFSAAFVPAFDELVTSDRYSVTITSSWGAAPVPGMRTNNDLGKVSDYYWDDVAPQMISHLRKGDSVFLVNDIADYLPKDSSSVSGQNFYRQLSAGLSLLSRQLDEGGIKLVVLDGLPFTREADCEPTLGVTQWFTPFGNSCHFLSKRETLRRRAMLDATLNELRDQGKITVIDLMDIFCPGKVCTNDAGNGHLLYRDESHPSVAAARLSAPIIRKVLESDDRTQSSANGQQNSSAVATHQ